jgi:Protein of unknown function (DUF1153).
MLQAPIDSPTLLPEPMRDPREENARLTELRPASGRWTPARKARVVMAIALGAVGRDRALASLDITEEELASWERRYDRAGAYGLRLTRLREYSG